MVRSDEGSFGHWVNRHKGVMTGLWGGVGMNLMLLVAMRLESIKIFVHKPWFVGVWFALHLLTVVTLFILTYYVPRRVSRKYAEPTKAVQDFYYFLLALWIVWAIMYGVLTYRALDTIPARIQLISASHDVKRSLTKEIDQKDLIDNRVDINDALNIADKYPSFQTTKDRTFDQSVTEFRTTRNILKSKSWEMLLNCLNNAQSAVILLLFWVLTFPRDTKQLFMIVLVVVLGTTVSALLDLAFKGSMDLIGGLFAGVAIALWVGRLDSKFLMAPQLAIVALYFYAILQATWFVFHEESDRVLVIAGLAMVLKVVIYLVSSWLLSSGRLLYFFQELRLRLGLAKEEEGDPMYGLTTVKDRLKAFLVDLVESEDEAERHAA